MHHNSRIMLENPSLHCPYLDDPLRLYEHLATSNRHNVLFESAEIDSKANLKSLIVADAAVKIVCQGREVKVEALSENGKAVIETLKHSALSPRIGQQDEHALHFHFALADLSIDEDSRLKAPSPVDVLRTLQQLYQPLSQHEHGVFLAGVFAYDFIASFEQLDEVSQGDNICPDFQFYLAETLLIIDHQNQSTELLASAFDSLQLPTLLERLNALAQDCAHVPANDTPSMANYQGKIQVNVSDAAFCQQVETLKDYIRQGDIFQVVPSRSFSMPCPEPLLAYRELKQSNPSPYMFYFQDREFALFGASPESAIKYSQDSRDVEIYPIAGTRRRGFNAQGGIDADLDGRIELDLRMDSKETAEHIMLVDLARNDVARISEPGTRHVADLLKVDRYSHVMHLVSRVVGTLRHDLDALHAYQACMNMGTLTGAPKIRASELIRQVEQQRRGSYGGAVGYLNGHGDMDTCIVIRSAFIKNGMAHVQAGAGVVYDSQAQAEADETRNKAAAVLSAIARSHGSSLQELGYEN